MLQRSRSRAKAPTPPRPLLSRAVAGVGAVLLLGVTGLVMVPAGAQIKGTTPEASAPAAKQIVSKPLWRDLSARQQRALEPLAMQWDGLTEPHKRKWLAISRNYAKLSPAEQEVLHSRMTEWATLSNQERSQARFNFAEVKQVPVDERKAKWEAYQALSEEEKRELAARATPRPGAAASIRPVPAQKLVPLPAVAPDRQHTPRIQLTPPSLPRQTAPIPAMAPAVTPPSGTPVTAEAQVPSPAAANPPADTPVSVMPPGRVTDQASAAP